MKSTFTNFKFSSVGKRLTLLLSLLPISLYALPFATAAASNTELLPPSNLKIEIDSSEKQDGASSGGETSPTQGVGKGTKWHPGHYTFAGQGIKVATKTPKIVGAENSYNWGDVETAKGKYDFSAIEKDLKTLQASKKRLVVKIRYKTFGGQAQRGQCAPQYIHDLGGVELEQYSDTPWNAASKKKIAQGRGDAIKRCVARAHMAPVKDALVRLMQALGKRFDREPYFEAIVTEETAGSGCIKPTKAETKKCNQDYYLSLQYINRKTREAFPHTVVLQQANWLSGGGMEELFADAVNSGYGFSGPDLMPERHTTSSELYPSHAGRIPLAMDNQRASLVGKSPVKAYDWAVNTLKLNYVFWAPHGTSDWDFETKIIPVIDKNNWRINTKCPKNIAPCVE